MLADFCFRGKGTVAVKKTSPCFSLLDTTLGRVQLAGISILAGIRDDSRALCGWYLIQESDNCGGRARHQVVCESRRHLGRVRLARRGNLVKLQVEYFPDTTCLSSAC